MDSILIRNAVAADALCIAEISRKTFYDTFVEFNSREDMDKFMTEEFSIDRLMNEVINREGIFILAEEGTRAIGYARMREGDRYAAFHEKTSIEIARIYVDKDAIGKGVGKKLMDECIGIAKREQRQIIWLGVWEHNQRAIDFYTRAGFEKFGEHEFVLGNDVQTDWLMMKSLS